MSLKSIDIPDDLKQSFWRIALNGNPHWVRYKTSTEKKRGANDEQRSLGGITKGGHDTRDQAGKSYWYTSPVVDEHQLGFGFWSRSDQGENSTYRFVAYDIEPIAPNGRKRVNANPPKMVSPSIPPSGRQTHWLFSASTGCNIWTFTLGAVLVVEADPCPERPPNS